MTASFFSNSLERSRYPQPSRVHPGVSAFGKNQRTTVWPLKSAREISRPWWSLTRNRGACDPTASTAALLNESPVCPDGTGYHPGAEGSSPPGVACREFMMCLLFVASEVSAFAGGDTHGRRGGDHVVFTLRRGAGHEGTGSADAGDERAVQLAAGG